jgi:nitroreductase
MTAVMKDAAGISANPVYLFQRIDMWANETVKIIKQRRSIRSYLEKQISEDDLNIILDAGIYSPHGGGDIEQDIHFTIVQNRNVLHKINLVAKEYAKQSNMDWLKNLGNDEKFDCLYNAPTLIIVSYKENSPCAVYDCSAVTQNMLLASESVGLGSCWLYFPLQAFDGNKKDDLIKELKIPNGFKPFTSMIVGYKKDTEMDIPERKIKNIFYVK